MHGFRKKHLIRPFMKSPKRRTSIRWIGFGITVFLFSLSVHAGGRIRLTPSVGFFSLSGQDRASLARAVVSAEYDLSVALGYFHEIGRFGELFLDFRMRAFETGAPPGTQVINAEQVQKFVRLGLIRKLDRGLLATFYLDYSEYLLLASASLSAIEVQNSGWPGVGLGIDHALFHLSSVLFSWRLGLKVATPLVPGYSPALSIDGGLKINAIGEEARITLFPFFEVSTTTSDVIEQFYTEIGIKIQASVYIGGKKGRPDFYFSPIP